MAHAEPGGPASLELSFCQLWSMDTCKTEHKCFSESYLQTGQGFSYLLGKKAPNPGNLKHSTLGMPEGRPRGPLLWAVGLRPPLAPKTESATPRLSLWNGSPTPKPQIKTTGVLAFQTRTVSRLRLISPQSHSANQKGQSAPTSPISTSAFAASSLSTGHHPTFFTSWILRSEPSALLSSVLDHIGHVERAAPPPRSPASKWGVSNLTKHPQQQVPRSQMLQICPFSCSNGSLWLWIKFPETKSYTNLKKYHLSNDSDGSIGETCSKSGLEDKKVARVTAFKTLTPKMHVET